MSSRNTLQKPISQTRTPGISEKCARKAEVIPARLINFDLDKKEASIQFLEFLAVLLRKRTLESLYRLKSGEVNYRGGVSCGYP